MKKIFVLIVICAGTSAFSQAVTQQIKWTFPLTVDSAWVEIYKNNTISSSSFATNKDTLDRTVLVPADTFTSVYIRWKLNGMYGWVPDGYLPFNRLSTATAVSLPLRLTYPDPIDTAQYVIERNGTIIQTLTDLTGTDFFTGFTFERNFVYTITSRIKYTDAGGWQQRAHTVFWDSTGSGGGEFPLPPSSNSVIVDGFVRRSGGVPAEYAQLTFTMVNANVKNTCDSTALLEFSAFAETDANGYFYVPLIKSTCLENNRWTITVKYPGARERKATVLVTGPSPQRITFFE